MSDQLLEAEAPAAAERFALEIPLPRLLTAKEQLTLARAAFARQPESAEHRHWLGRQLTQLDFFDEAVEVLEGQRREEFRDLHMFGMALLSRETREDDQRTLEVGKRAAEIAATPRQRAMAITQMAKAHTRLGETERAAELLREALVVYPGERDAFKRLFKYLMARDPEQALRLTDDALAQGVVHPRVLAGRALALAQLRRLDEAHEAEGFDEFHQALDLPTPPGWDSLEQFNEALTSEALDHPDMRFDRYNTASTRTWRLDEPALHRTKIFPQLQQAIKREVERYVAALPQDGHPLVQAIPARAYLRNWCVITEEDGHETWHVHQNGWLSGVYYIHIQDHIAQGTGRGGCIAFGLPSEEIDGEAAAKYGERIVRPHSGLMMLFPSHSYHRTYPHGGTGRRICFAFDIIPVAESA